MPISRKQALKKIRGTSAAIREHLDKLKKTTNPYLRRYWLRETKGLIGAVREIAGLVGERTQSEVMARVIEWEKEITEVEETHS
jgi:hypothetical protein